MSVMFSGVCLYGDLFKLNLSYKFNQLMVIVIMVNRTFVNQYRCMTLITMYIKVTPLLNTKTVAWTWLSICVPSTYVQICSSNACVSLTEHLIIILYGIYLYIWLECRHDLSLSAI